jgi:AraC-like DNA-binding protein
LHPIIALLARAFGEAGLLSYTVVICEGRLQQSKQSTLNY